MVGVQQIQQLRLVGLLHQQVLQLQQKVGRWPRVWGRVRGGRVGEGEQRNGWLRQDGGMEVEGLGEGEGEGRGEERQSDHWVRRDEEVLEGVSGGESEEGVNCGGGWWWGGG